MRHIIGYGLTISLTIIIMMSYQNYYKLDDLSKPDLSGQFLAPNTSLEIKIQDIHRTSFNVHIAGTIQQGDCTHINSLLVQSDAGSTFQSISTKATCGGVDVTLDGYFSSSLSSKLALTHSDIIKETIIYYTVAQVYRLPTENHLPLICFILINIILAGALGGVMYHLAAGIEHRTRIYIPFTKVLVNQPDGSTKEFPKSLEPTILADAFSGALAAILTMGAAYILTSFTVDPILISSADCQLQNPSNGYINCSVSEVFRTWILLYAISILGGFGGLRLVTMFSKELMDKLQKKIQDHEQAIEKTQTSVDSLLSSQSEQLAAIYYSDGYQKQEKGFHKDAIRYFQKALDHHKLAKHWSSLGFSQSFLSTNDAFDQALHSISEGFALVNDKTDEGVKYALSYNRACINHLKHQKENQPPSTYIKGLIADLDAAYAINPSQFKIDFKADTHKGGDFSSLSKLASENDLPDFKEAIERYYHETIDLVLP